METDAQNIWRPYPMVGGKKEIFLLYIFCPGGLVNRLGYEYSQIQLILHYVQVAWFSHKVFILLNSYAAHLTNKVTGPRN